MSSRLTLSPAELDRLEDALEDLELHEELGLPEEDPVAQRLVEFREILQLSRQALPMEDVPAGLLDGVLAEARQAAAAVEAAPARGSFWSRWRLGVWVPTLAFAGSAALLLLVLVPKQDEEAPAAGDAAVARADASAKEEQLEAEAESAPDEAVQGQDARLAYSDLEAREGGAAGDEVERGQGVAIGERAPEPEPDPAAEPIEEEAPADDPAASDEASRRKATGRTSSSASSGSKPAPAPPSKSAKAPAGSGGAGQSKGGPPLDPYDGGDEKKDEKKEESKNDAPDLWPEINRADADRRGGSCGLAKMRYDKARKADDARVRARALAGLGLCAAAEGDAGTAKKLFAQARAADPGVSGFIDRELAAKDEPRANAAEEANQQQSRE